MSWPTYELARSTPDAACPSKNRVSQQERMLHVALSLCAMLLLNLLSDARNVTIKSDNRNSPIGTRLHAAEFSLHNGAHTAT